MKLNCLIVDDEPVARKILEEYIEDIDFLTLAGKAENPLKATVLLQEQHIDLMFLDINMPQLSGIDFIKSSASLPMTILTTAYPDYALESYELEVLDYLVKPIPPERFLKACIKAKEYHQLRNNPSDQRAEQPGYFFVKSDRKIEKVLYEELVCVEALQNYVVLHTESKKMIAYLTMKRVEDQLPASLFLKIHKSTIINVSKVKSIQGNEVDLGKMTVTISQGLLDNVFNKIVKDRLMNR